MSRIARVAVEGVPYHVTQRGNGRQQVFFCDEDYRLYLDLLRMNAMRHRLQVWGQETGNRTGNPDRTDRKDEFRGLACPRNAL